MSHFNKLITKRRSIRKFTNELLNSDDVELILKAGLMAPSSKKRNPWEFIVVENKDQLAKLANCKSRGSILIKDAAIAIAIIGNPLVSDVWIEDTSIAAILMQLQAEDLDIGSCWVQVRNRETEYGVNSEEFVKELLEIPHPMQVLSVIAFGKKGESKSPFSEENIEWEKVHLEKW